jgi:thiol-disulfide isomerase/thioredoxin
VHASFRRSLVCAPLVVATAAAIMPLPLSPCGAADQAAPPAVGSRGPTVPPVPAGPPAALFAYIERLTDPAALPSSRGRLRYYQRKAAAATAEAAARIMAQTKAGDAEHARAIELRFTALEALRRFEEPGSAAALAAFAESLSNSPDAAVAERARRLALRAQIDAALEAGRPDDAAPLVGRIAALLRQAPDDAELAGAAVGLATKLGRLPGGEAAAAAALDAFLPILEASDSEMVRGMGERAAGPARRLDLPGNPMKITGTLLSTGEPFDQASLAGKVVLVDFWATWCGPCVAEIGNLKAEYAKWHAKGFEVVGVSLDEDRDTLEQFVKAREIPWPILYEEPGGPDWRHPLATYYGITGIPTVVLIGRDGNVITLDARGRKLGVALEKLLGEPAARIGDRR